MIDTKQQIKELRAKTGLSQSKFAKKYDLNLRTLQNWESGHRNANCTILKLIEKQISNERENEKNV